jgi:hypothetical protein
MGLVNRLVTEYEFDTYNGLMQSLIGQDCGDIEEVIDFLLMSGVKINESTAQGTPLSYAVKCSNIKAIRKLLLCRADVQTVDVNLIPLKSGLSLPLTLLYYAGYQFPENFGSNIDAHLEVRKELNWFKSWLEIQKKKVLEDESLVAANGGKTFRVNKWVTIKNLQQEYDPEVFEYKEPTEDVYYIPKCRVCHYEWTSPDDLCPCKQRLPQYSGGSRRESSGSDVQKNGGNSP